MEQVQKKGPLDAVIDVISGIIAPTLGLLGAAGIVRGLLALCVFLGWLSEASGTYQLLYTVGDGFFYFLPVVLGLTAAQKLGFEPLTGLAMGMCLCYPTIAQLSAGEPLGTVLAGTPFAMSYYTTFLRLPVIVPQAGYTSTVVPVILGALMAAPLERWCKRVIPEVVQMFLTPVCVLCVVVPVLFLVIGPVSTLLCNALSLAVQALFGLPVVGGLVAGAAVGGVWQLLVMLGLHWGIIPLIMINLATLGYDYIFPCSYACSWIQCAAVLAVLLKTRDKKRRETAISALAAGFFGITEPAIYGVTLPAKKPFVITCLASAVSGAWAGATGTAMHAIGALGLFALPAFIDPAPGADALYSLVQILIATAIGMAVCFVLVWLTYREPAQAQDI